ncbi:unnamed protein product, partial [Closterium sp. Naga37s-1]
MPQCLRPHSSHALCEVAAGEHWTSPANWASSFEAPRRRNSLLSSPPPPFPSSPVPLLPRSPPPPFPSSPAPHLPHSPHPHLPPPHGAASLRTEQPPCALSSLPAHGAGGRAVGHSKMRISPAGLPHCAVSPCLSLCWAGRHTTHHTTLPLPPIPTSPPPPLPRSSHPHSTWHSLPAHSQPGRHLLAGHGKASPRWPREGISSLATGRHLLAGHSPAHLLCGLPRCAFMPLPWDSFSGAST